jgi:hypothetical protein
MNNTRLRKIKNKIKNNDEFAFRLKILTIKISDFLSNVILTKFYIKKQYRAEQGGY